MINNQGPAAWPLLPRGYIRLYPAGDVFRP